MKEGEVVNILDHGYVKFIGSMGTDETVIDAARMSVGRGFIDWDSVKECKRCRLRFPGHQTVIGYQCNNGTEEHDWKKLAGDVSLLEFLYMNRHMTPFEMGELCIEVKAPIFVFREWHRHRTQSYNEFSARYETMPNEHYIPETGRIQKQSALNKQGSGASFESTDADIIRDMLDCEQALVYQNYEKFLEKGVAKEVARINTPVSRYSKMRAKTDVRNWLSFLTLRCENSAQWEIRQFANVVAGIIKSIWPRTYELFLEHDFFAVRFSRKEMRELRDFFACTAEDIVSGFGDADTVKRLGGEKKLKLFLDKLTKDKEAEYPDLPR